MEALLQTNVIVPILISLILAIFSHRLGRVGELLISYISSSINSVHDYVVRKKWKLYREAICAARGKHKVTLNIVRTYAFLIIFLLIFFTYLLLILTGPLKGIGELPRSVQLFIASPIYVFEALWLIQKEKMLFLIHVSEKRVTKFSNSGRLKSPWFSLVRRKKRTSP